MSCSATGGGSPGRRWLFPGRDPMQPLTTRQFNRVVHAAAAAAEINKRVTPHTLRHSFGARIGITAVLHTWGSAMTHIPTST